MALIIESHLRPGDGKRLAGKPGGQHVNRGEVVGHHRMVLNRFVKERGLREIAAIGLSRKIVPLVGPCHVKALLLEGKAEAAHARKEAPDAILSA